MKITTDVHIVGDGGFGLSHWLDCCVYLLNCGDEWLMIDAGGGTGGPEILANIASDGVDPHSIKTLILTHAHADHACSAAFFKEKLGVKVLASEVDGQLIEGGTDAELGMGTARGPIFPSDYQYIHTKVDRKVKDGETIRIGDRELTFFVVPGHTPGSLCVLSKKDGLLFSGDVVFYNGTIGLGNWDGSELGPYRANIGKLSGLGVKQLFPGHFMFALKDGQSHVDKAIANLKLPWVPPVWGHNHPAR
jgi:glyoxylase-like metal-dependent hydrolase (beta-lactamase superfamily II)